MPALILIYPHDTGLPQRRDKPIERDPPRSIHMHMILILDILVVHCVRAHTVRLMPCPEEEEELVLELSGELGNRRTCIWTDCNDFAQVWFGAAMGLETVFVAHLLFTDLAVPS